MGKKEEGCGEVHLVIHDRALSNSFRFHIIIQLIWRARKISRLIRFGSRLIDFARIQRAPPPPSASVSCRPPASDEAPIGLQPVLTGICRLSPSLHPPSPAIARHRPPSPAIARLRPSASAGARPAPSTSIRFAYLHLISSLRVSA